MRACTDDGFPEFAGPGSRRIDRPSCGPDTRLRGSRRLPSGRRRRGGHALRGCCRRDRVGTTPTTTVAACRQAAGISGTNPISASPRKRQSRADWLVHFSGKTGSPSAAPGRRRKNCAQRKSAQVYPLQAARVGVSLCCPRAALEPSRPSSAAHERAAFFTRRRAAPSSLTCALFSHCVGRDP